MFDFNKHRAGNQASFRQSMQGFATTAAAALTLFVAPALYELTHEHVSQITEHFYGYGQAADMVGVAWKILVWPLSFFALRATLVTAIMMGALTAVRYGVV